MKNNEAIRNAKNFDELLFPCHVAQAQLKVSSPLGNSSSPHLHFSSKYVWAITHQPLRFSICFCLLAWRTCFSSSLNFRPKVSKANEEKGNETENWQPWQPKTLSILGEKRKWAISCGINVCFLQQLREK